MTKVFEALEKARTEREYNLPSESRLLIKPDWSSQPKTGGIPALTMESAMRRLFHSARPLLPHAQHVSVQFTASRKAEGTSTIVREFALFLSQRMMKSVLILDQDAAALSHHHAFGITPKQSLQWMMSEGRSPSEAISSTGALKLALCVYATEYTETGPVRQEPVDLSLWKTLRNSFDFVLVDSPPLSFSEDALVLSPFVDGTILVVEAEKTRSEVALNLRNALTRTGGNVVGIVFNKQRHYIPNWLYRYL